MASWTLSLSDRRQELPFTRQTSKITIYPRYKEIMTIPVGAVVAWEGETEYSSDEEKL